MMFVLKHHLIQGGRAVGQPRAHGELDEEEAQAYLDDLLERADFVVIHMVVKLRLGIL